MKHSQLNWFGSICDRAKRWCPNTIVCHQPVHTQHPVEAQAPTGCLSLNDWSRAFHNCVRAVKSNGPLGPFGPDLGVQATRALTKMWNALIQLPGFE